MKSILEERYVTREDHERVIEFYKKVVVHLYARLKTDPRPDVVTLDDVLQHARNTAAQLRDLRQGSIEAYGNNIIDLVARREMICTVRSGPFGLRQP